MTKLFQWVLCLGVVLSLAACSSWVGGAEEDPPLEGERLSILQFEKELKPDTSLDVSDFALSKPWRNEYWPGAGGYVNHVMGNLLVDSSSLKSVWKSDIGTAHEDGVSATASPIVAGNRIYTMDLNSVVRSFDLKTGKEIFAVRAASKEEVGVTPGGGLAFAEGRIVATTGFNEIVALDPKNGGLIWRYQTNAPLRAAPAVMGGRIFAVTMGSETLALSIEDGSLLWRHAGIKESIGLVGAASPAIDRSVVIVPYPSGEVYALRSENGQEIWSQNLGFVSRFDSSLSKLTDIQALPVMDAGVIYAMNYSGSLVAIEQRSGAKVWQQRIGGSNTPWVSGDYLFVLSNDNALYGLDKKSGKVIWVEKLPQYANVEEKRDPILFQGPVIMNNELILINNKEELWRMSPMDGKLIFKTEINHEVEVTPIVAQETMFLQSKGGYLLAYQ